MEQITSRRLKGAFLLGFVSAATAFLYLGHQVTTTWGQVVAGKTGGPHAAYQLFLAEFSLALIPVFLCSGIGFFLSERYRVPGLGDIRKTIKIMPILAAMAIPALFLGYILHDRIFMEGELVHGWPPMIPHEIGWALAYIAYGVFFKEVIFRFGLVTLMSGLFRGRRPYWAVGIVTAFAAGMSMRELGFAGQTPGYDLTTLSIFAWALVFNAALGLVYVKKGLWATMALRAFIDFRYVIFILFAIK